MIVQVAKAAFLLSCLLSAPGLTFGRLTPHHASGIARRASTCNGHAELCDRSYGNVTFVGAHDSYAVGATNLAANQDYNVSQQLSDGIRLLQVQAHNNTDGNVHLCHTSCSLLDGGTLQNYLQSVKSWMDANPNDVVTLLIVNIDDMPATAYTSAFTSSGLNSLAYAPSSATLASTAWPTLGQLINQGKRLVVLMDFKADTTQVPYIIDEFANVWETAFDVTSQDFDCNLNRTGSADNKMYLINHFLDKEQNVLGFNFPTPDKSKLTETNAASGTGSLGLQAQNCAAQWGRYPNYMLVDFYDYGGGSVFQVAASLNGVQDNSPSISPPSSTASAGASPSASYKPNGAFSIATYESPAASLVCSISLSLLLASLSVVAVL